MTGSEGGSGRGGRPDEAAGGSDDPDEAADGRADPDPVGEHGRRPAGGDDEGATDDASAPGRTGGRRARVGTLATMALLVLMVGTALLAMLSVTPRREEDRIERPPASDVVIAGAGPASWDPARIADAASAQVLAQVFEGLTVLDQDSRVRPGLAESWSVGDDGRVVTFHLRPDITFSDGSPILAEDVRCSWLRVLDPRHPSPLAGLLIDIVGASAYLAGEVSADAVGISVDGDEVRVEMARPAAWLPVLLASPTLAIVPPGIDEVAGGTRSPADLPVSGAYRVEALDAGSVRLAANPAYWAGPPALGRVTVLTDLGGRSPVEAFEDGAVDWTSVYDSDVPWLRYDRRLGPQLRSIDVLAVDLLGFDTRRPPFDRAAARRAVSMAVDWRRIAELAAPDLPAPTSMLPPGIPGRSEEDFLPRHDPEAARAALAAAGYPGGAGFPRITLSTYGVGQAEAIALELERELGIQVDVELRPFAEQGALLDRDPPHMWTISWSADYPHPDDFLGLLLRSDRPTNDGGWSHAGYDQLLDRAAATTDAAEQERLYAEAQRVVRDEAPMIPLGYVGTWALARDGLLGASGGSGGIVRFANLAWAG